MDLQALRMQRVERLTYLQGVFNTVNVLLFGMPGSPLQPLPAPLAQHLRDVAGRLFDDINALRAVIRRVDADIRDTQFQLDHWGQ
jgi:hypothetical protein